MIMRTEKINKLFTTLLFVVLMPVSMHAQSTNGSLEEAQKKLEKAQKELEKAKKEMEEAAKASQSKEQKQSNSAGWVVPVTKSKKNNTVAKSTTNNAKDNKNDEKYHAGAVTTDADGKVKFALKLNIPNKTAKEIYDTIYEQLYMLTEDENQFDESSIALVNPQTKVIAAKYKEWLVFNNNFLSLDRAIFNYTIIAQCEDNKLNLTLERISYEYETDRPSGFKAKAEELITDKEALNKKGNKLNRLTGKFRRKTIDRKEQIFENIKSAFKL